jgi:hypothetical protein
VDELDMSFRTYIDDARKDLDEQSAAEGGEWQAILERLEQMWFADISVVLRGLALGSTITDADDLAALDSLQAAFDRFALTRVEDNTVSIPLADYAAWYRTWEQLQEPTAAVAAKKVQEATYDALVRDPQRYRGRMVRIRGEARSVKRIAEGPNPLGIEAYYVVWLKPDTANAPLCLYTLELPADFPEAASLKTDGPAAALREVPLEITGVFFKKRAYRAESGVELAPLILARSAVVLKAPSGAQPLNLWFAGIVAAIVAAVASVFVFVRTRGNPGPDLPEMPEWPTQTRGPSLPGKGDRR